MPPLLTSRQHPVCKLVRALHAPRGRRRHGLFVVEGGHGVTEALRARWPLHELLTTPAAWQDGWSEVAAAAGVEVRLVSEELLEYLSDAQTAPEIIALAKLPSPESSSTLPDDAGCVLVLDSVSDPGNVGTLLRAADAAGASGVLPAGESADPFSPKVVRASAGSLFHLPPWQPPDNSPAAVVELLRERGFPLVAAVAHDGMNCYEYSWPRRCALALGHEARGISPEIEAAADARVSIPIYGAAESLNVAMAGTLLLYAWQRGAAS
jgi:TrmH family RNA methyltransferase